ncbi:YhdH/YhfP family quinone oxidoreductase [Lactococcus garvieae]|uniref:YhdH/YhfP family quinone oxidoreductase n=1 Tax=Lactococcus garvieae TaxID=1363 RepID=A0AA43PEZ8_9LACT|nr:YhdH/YhfP family quinone oxidoreductase [Lactococcus garvieae]MDH7959409.1 YhdH/YhfP family quinone oxidoreductase [Lactococcus garvieae]BDM76580.1 oxidoreductase [Lactococcus garvieae]BDW51848.1 oxidoreductase [Lactococcus garvieae]
MKEFNALVVREENENITYKIEDNVTSKQLNEGDVLVKVHYSSLNYKDMLAVQKNGGVIRKYPMIPGIDLSGTIVESNDPAFSIGQEVLVTGYDMGMSHTGGLSEYTRIPSSWVIPLPKNLSLKEAMIYGTAGLTAGLSIDALEEEGLSLNKEQTVLVTGTTGGVGSLALQILSKMGYKNLIALVRKEYQIEVAQKLGANDVILLENFEFGKKPLNKQKFDYILDTVGGELLSNLIPFVSYGGSISMCGNAAGIKLNTTVLPFILRGINLLGIDSVNISREKRVQVWNKLASEWKITDTTLVNEIILEDVPETIVNIKSGTHLGRTIVKIHE